MLLYVKAPDGTEANFHDPTAMLKLATPTPPLCNVRSPGDTSEVDGGRRPRR
jgi:hypothetical protein